MMSSAEVGPAEIVVVIPAHNEEVLMRRCLSHVMAARQHMLETESNHRSVRIVVVLDACTDNTAALVAAFPGIEVVVVRHHRVGSARRAGAEHAIGGRDPSSVWLASTDADSAVPREWLTAMLQYAASGLDLVLGTVLLDIQTPNAIVEAWRLRYRQTHGHRHIHGANLGIRGDAYRLLGGWPEVTSDEDVQLVRWAESAGLRIARAGNLAVVTSGRSSARAPRGFASYLDRLAAISGPLV